MSYMMPVSLPVNCREAISFALELIETNLSDKFTYHTSEHTRSVIAVADILAKSEGIEDKSVELLLVAAAWHDSGYMNEPYKHEEESCRLAKSHLPDFGFNIVQVEEVCRIIMATRIPQNPTDLITEIICDADLSYLGTDQYEHNSDLLYREFKLLGLIDNPNQWIDRQISFLTSHHFFTASAKNLYDEIKLRHLSTLIKLKKAAIS